MNVTDFQIRVLRAMVGQSGAPAAFIAKRVWEPVKCQARGHQHAQWQAMGGQLGKLKKLGLVDCYPSAMGQKLWSINRAGRNAIPRAPSRRA